MMHSCVTEVLLPSNNEVFTEVAEGLGLLIKGSRARAKKKKKTVIIVIEVEV